MLNLIRGNIEVEILHSDDGKYRYILKKVWNKELPMVTVLTLYPANNKLIESDLTTMLITNNVYQLGYGGFFNVNLFPRVFTGKREYKSDKYNDDCILECVKNSEIVVIACGSLIYNNKKVRKRYNELEVILKNSKKNVKLVSLTDVNKENIYHPLSPKIRRKWYLM